MNILESIEGLDKASAEKIPTIYNKDVASDTLKALNQFFDDPSNPSKDIKNIIIRSYNKMKETSVFGHGPSMEHEEQYKWFAGLVDASLKLVMFQTDDITRAKLAHILATAYYLEQKNSKDQNNLLKVYSDFGKAKAAALRIYTRAESRYGLKNLPIFLTDAIKTRLFDVLWDRSSKEEKLPEPSTPEQAQPNTQA